MPLKLLNCFREHRTESAKQFTINPLRGGASPPSSLCADVHTTRGFFWIDSMKTCGIYGIRNTLNGKWYIGQSIECESRKQDHLSALRTGKHFNRHLQGAFIEYGEKNFVFHLLEECLECDLDIREWYWIAFYKSRKMAFGYNFESGGHKNKHISIKTRQKLSEALRGRVSPMKGRHQSSEHKNKLHLANIGKQPSALSRLNSSIFMKQRWLDPVFRAKMCKERKERWLDPAERAKMCNGMRGKKLSPERRKKLSEFWKGKHHTAETRKKLSELVRKWWYEKRTKQHQPDSYSLVP